MSFEQVEECWQLIDEARAFAQARSQKLQPADYWEQFFKVSDKVDIARTVQEEGAHPTRIYLNSPYGLQWRPAYGDWIPFRHGAVELPPLTLD